MILLIDVGNTNIVLAHYDNEITDVFRINTRKDFTPDEYSMLLDSKLKNYQYEGIIISSVAPRVTQSLTRYCKKHLKIKPMIVGPGIKTGVNIKTDNPKEVGSDIIVSAVASFNYGENAIIIDLGTASTITLIENKVIKGVVITPGIKTSLSALVSDTSMLPEVDLKRPKNILGTNTIESIQSGIINGHVYMIDGFLKNLTNTNKDYKIIITGGFSSVIGELINFECIVSKDLILEGLVDIYYKNSK
ncbi:type III pantothenate kinase [Mycoplasmatota bacterium WC44]